MTIGVASANDDLGALQARLEGHFATLASARKARSLPVFAFEHGLDATELADLPGLLKAILRTGDVTPVSSSSWN